MDLLSKPFLLLTLLALALVAGCAAAPGEDDGGDVTPPPQMTTAEARDLLASAVEDMPDVFAVNMSVLSGSRELMSVSGSFDNRSGTTYMVFRGDAEALSQLGGEEGGMAAAFLANGFTLYATPQGSVFLANGTAFTFPPDEGDEGEVGGPFGSEDSPLGALVAGDDLLRTYGDDSDVVVTSVTPTVYRGKPAIELVATGVEDNETFTATLVVFTSPRRIAHLETMLPMEEGESATSPFNNATLEADFFYDDEVDMRAPQTVVRALGLSYSGGTPDFFGSGSGQTTWTFLVSGGIALSEAEVQVKEGARDPQDFDPASLPTAWSMKLSEGTKTQGGVTLTFTDADGDAKVSRNDTLVASVAEDGEMPPLLLYDTVTGTAIVPGPGLALLLVALGAAVAFARRR